MVSSAGGVTRARRRGGSVILTVHSRLALCIAVQRGAKSGGNVPQPFVCLAVGIRQIWRKFRVSVSDHRPHFGNCFSPALAAR